MKYVMARNYGSKLQKPPGYQIKTSSWTFSKTHKSFNVQHNGAYSVYRCHVPSTIVNTDQKRNCSLNNKRGRAGESVDFSVKQAGSETLVLKV